MFRPYVKEFLSQLHKEFEIIIFAYTDESYATPIINHLDPTWEFI